MFGKLAGIVGMGITTIQTWWMPYESMNNLQYAPMHIDKDGNPINVYDPYDDPSIN